MLRLSPVRPTPLLAAVLAAGLALGPPGASAQENVEAQPPSFSDPLRIDNQLAPFVVGAVKIYSGKEHGTAVTIVESFTLETRDFLFGDVPVSCRVIEEMKFEKGALVGREQVFLAQADDGAVWKFGEIEDDDPDDDDQDDEDEPGGWVVGLRLPSDAPDVLETPSPSLFMPANPRPRQTWRTEDIPPELLTEVTVLSVRAGVRLSGGRYRDCLRLLERDEDDGTTERRWFAPGIGFVRSRSRGERLTLQATTIRAIAKDR